MGNSGDPARDAAREAKRALARTELAQIELTDAETADAIGTVLLSVVRDLAVSGYYGKTWHSSGALPTLEDVFAPAFAANVDRELRALASVRNLDFPIYGNMGDALGMLSRILVYCRDIDQLRPMVSAADARIEQLGADVSHMADNHFIRHLRNAVLHSHFKVLADAQDPFKSRFVFIDLRGGELTAKIVLSNNQLVEVVRIIVHEVFETYLANLPNNKRWITGQ